MPRTGQAFGRGLSPGLAVLIACLAWATVPALAQMSAERGENVKAAAGIVSRTWEPTPPTNPSHSWQIYRFLVRHGIAPKPNYKLPRTEAPVWLNDAIMGKVRDRPARPRIGPKMGTYYDREGRIRAWVPAPPPPGRVRVLESPPMELLRRYAKGWINWKDEIPKARAALPADRRSAVDRMMDQSTKEIKDSAHLYKALLRIAKDAESVAGQAGAGSQLPEDCEASDAAVAAITARLSQEIDNPSRVASLAKRHPGNDAVKKMLNCICRVHSGKTETVSVWYQNTPHEGSDNCMDVGNGPCVGQGWGCSRSQFIPDKAALDSCGAGRVMAKAICESRKARKK